jgi:hypothetical protein
VRTPRAIRGLEAADAGAQITEEGRKAPFYNSRGEVNLSLETRSIPRQILYLTLALIALMAVLTLLAHWHL